MALLGVGLIAASLFTTWILVFYGIPSFILGMVILFNRKENEIEPRKDLNKSKTKKR
jgi:membrane-bound ClpP family serine protease